MNIETLKYFRYIAKYKNMTRAANHFFVSQSTLSRQIMSLEEEVGSLLFDREKRNELTDAGKVLEEKIDIFLDLYETMMEDVKRAGKGDIGRLRITTQGIICHEMNQLLNDFIDNNQDVEVIVEANNFVEIPSSVLFEVHDIGFSYDFVIPAYMDIEQLPIASDQFAMIVPSRKYPNASANDIGRIVGDLPLIIPPDVEPPFMHILKNHLQELGGVQEIKTKKVKNIDSIILDVSLGMGYSIVAESLFKTKVINDEISFIDLKHAETKANIVMLYRKENNSELAKHFINSVKAKFS